VELVLGVLKPLLPVRRATHGLVRALRLGDRTARDVRDRGHALGDDVGTREVDRLSGAAQLLDATLELSRVVLRLLEVLLEALLVRRRLRKLNVRGERSLELLLLAVRLVEPLDHLRITGVHICHLTPLLPLLLRRFVGAYPVRQF